MEGLNVQIQTYYLIMNNAMSKWMWYNLSYFGQYAKHALNMYSVIKTETFLDLASKREKFITRCVHSWAFRSRRQFYHWWYGTMGHVFA